MADKRMKNFLVREKRKLRAREAMALPRAAQTGKRRPGLELRCQPPMAQVHVGQGWMPQRAPPPAVHICRPSRMRQSPGSLAKDSDIRDRTTKALAKGRLAVGFRRAASSGLALGAAFLRPHLALSPQFLLAGGWGSWETVLVRDELSRSPPPLDLDFPFSVIRFRQLC